MSANEFILVMALGICILGVAYYFIDEKGFL